MNCKAVVIGLVNVEKDYQEFDFGEILIDYERIYQRLKARKDGMTRKEIHEMLPNISYSAVSQVITTLSIRYPLYSPSRGVYKLLTEEDFEQ